MAVSVGREGPLPIFSRERLDLVARNSDRVLIMSELIIKRAWTHESQPDRIHFIVVYGDTERHLWEPRTTELGKILVRYEEAA